MTMAGAYRHFIRIQRISPAATKTAANEIDKTKDSNWETFAERWMEIIPKGGGETTTTQVESFLNHEVRARYDSVTAVITPQHRLKYETRNLNVTSIKTVDEARREVVMECVEVV